VKDFDYDIQREVLVAICPPTSFVAIKMREIVHVQVYNDVNIGLMGVRSFE